jgi:hypothetical protein
MSEVSRPGAEQLAERNRQTAANWDCFASHRQRLQTLLASQASAKHQTLCLLGAGNCNDLDLRWLCERFKRVTLVDLDLAAMEAGVSRQLGRPPANLKLAALDLTGVLAELASVSRPATDEQCHAIELVCERLPAVERLTATYDVVVSSCVLSQIVESLTQGVGEAHRRFLPLIQALRRQHLRTLIGLTAPGGRSILVTDFVSSVTAGDMAAVPERQLRAYAERLLAQRNFFSGLNPMVLQQTFEEALRHAGRPSRVQVTSPWRWDLGPRLYLVTALTAQPS